MSYVDDDLARFMHAFDPEPVRAQRREREAVRRNLLRLAVFCAVVLAVVVLAACSPSDVFIAGGAA